MHLPKGILIGLYSALALCALACSDPPADIESHPVPQDLTHTEAGKADSTSFNANKLMTDEVFEDADFITANDIQRFLEETPYGHPSFMATYAENGMSVAEKIVEAAQMYRINPLVILIKLQVESSLIFKAERPNQFLLDRAMGCGCHDGDPSCHRGELGLFPQIDCGARLLRSYISELDTQGQTISGWKVGDSKLTSDETAIVPRNRATAALYTYTPWVLMGSGGNWLFWNVMRRFSRQLLKYRPNHRWIGGPCQTANDCGYDGAICLGQHPNTGNPNVGVARPGICSLTCESTCPDSNQPYTATTICAVDVENDIGLTGGLCLSRCVPSIGEDACYLGRVCGAITRATDTSSSSYSACLPSSTPEISATGDNDEAPANGGDDETLPPDDESNFGTD